MRPSEWAMQHVETLARHHRAVWVEDPYALIEDGEISLLQHRIGLTGHVVLAVESAFMLRQELEERDPSTARVVIIDQSYTLRDPHLLPKDAKPADLRPLSAPDWKPLLNREAVFRPTVRDFLIYVTGDDRWPAEVNIYPYEKLARDNAHGFLPGREMPKLTGKSFGEGYGFTLDYFAELLHLLRGSLLPVDPAGKYHLHNAKGRDVEPINKIVRGLIKLLHPDGHASDEELADYVAFAIESRQRVKDQLCVIAPGEYPQHTIEYENAGARVIILPKENEREIRDFPPDVSQGVRLIFVEKADPRGSKQGKLQCSRAGEIPLSQP